jgi:antirestriction protein
LAGKIRLSIKGAVTTEIKNMTVTAEISTETEQRIYIACLAAYNNGILHGEWIDVNQDIDQIWNEIRNVLASSPIPDAEEWAIHDFEGFGSIRLSEWEGIERVHELAEFMQEHGKVGMIALEHFCGDIEDAEKALDNYMGCFTSLADYAQDISENTTEVPEYLQYYIDYERMGRDIEMNGDVFTVQTSYDEVHVFLNH